MQVTPESLRPSPATFAPGLGVPTADQLWPFHRSAAFRPMPRSLMWLPTAQQSARETQLTPLRLCAPFAASPGSGVAILDQRVPFQCRAWFSAVVPLR